MADTAQVVCVLNKSEPPYQPNIYLCQNNSKCCTFAGQAICCKDDVSLREMFLQSYPLVLLFVGLQLVAAVVHWYFHDQDRVASIEHERSAKKAVIEALYPVSEDEYLDDPLFGPLYDELVPRRAYIEQDRYLPAPTNDHVRDEVARRHNDQPTAESAGDE